MEKVFIKKQSLINNENVMKDFKKLSTANAKKNNIKTNVIYVDKKYDTKNLHRNAIFTDLTNNK